MSFESLLRQLLREELPGIIREELTKLRGVEAEGEYLRTSGVAAMTGFTEKWIRECARRGELKSVSGGKGGKRLYLRADVVQWVESMGRKSQSAKASVEAKCKTSKKGRQSKLMTRELWMDSQDR